VYDSSLETYLSRIQCVKNSKGIVENTLGRNVHDLYIGMGCKLGLPDLIFGCGHGNAFRVDRFYEQGKFDVVGWIRVGILVCVCWCVVGDYNNTPTTYLPPTYYGITIIYG
jgi:hypothetical protein